MNNSRLHAALLAIVLGVLTWSGIGPHDRFTWFLEVAPALIGMLVLFITYKKFPLSNLLYVLIAIHMIILMIGGHYTYAEVPLFNWLRDAFDLSRNHYDRVGHFAQGFIPALVAREILLRLSPLQRGRLLSFIIVCICLAISAAYELIEFGMSVATGTAADAFLGSQGDVWDSQKDMLMCLIGAITALFTMPRFHDRSLQKLQSTDSLDS
ncbi:MAG: DUF2238 domain-containing protein [Syntrophomonadaceae bacterium]